MLRILTTGWLGSYVPGTANSMSRHMSSFGETYCSSKDVNCWEPQSTIQLPSWERWFINVV